MSMQEAAGEKEIATGRGMWMTRKCVTGSYESGFNKATEDESSIIERALRDLSRGYNCSSRSMNFQTMVLQCPATSLQGGERRDVMFKAADSYESEKGKEETWSFVPENRWIAFASVQEDRMSTLNSNSDMKAYFSLMKSYNVEMFSVLGPRFVEEDENGHPAGAKGITLYMVDLSSMMMIDSNRNAYKIKLDFDPLIQYVNKCKATQITSQMLGRSVDDFRCPKTGIVPVAPVAASDGYVYDYDQLKKILEDGAISPFTGQQLKEQIYPAQSYRFLMMRKAKFVGFVRNGVSSSLEERTSSCTSKSKRRAKFPAKEVEPTKEMCPRQLSSPQTPLVAIGFQAENGNHVELSDDVDEDGDMSEIWNRNKKLCSETSLQTPSRSAKQTSSSTIVNHSCDSSEEDRAFVKTQMVLAVTQPVDVQ